MFKKIFIFIIVAVIGFNVLSCFFGSKIEFADEEFMKGFWVTTHLEKEKFDDIYLYDKYKVVLYLHNNHSLGYYAYIYDGELNLHKNELLSIWDTAFEEAISMAESKTNKNTWKMEKNRLVLTINGKEYKSKEKVKKVYTFFMKSLVLEDSREEKVKLKANFLQIVNKNGPIDHSKNPVLRTLQNWIFDELDIF